MILKSPIFQILLEDKVRNLCMFILFVTLSLGAAIFEGFSFSCILFALSSLDGKELVPIPWLTLSHYSSKNMFVIWIVVAIGFQCLRSVLSYLSQLGMISLGAKIQNKIQFRIFHQIYQFSFPFISHYKTADLTDYCDAPHRICSESVQSLSCLFVSFFSCIILILLMTALSFKLTVSVFFFFLLITYIQRKLSKIIIDKSIKLKKHHLHLNQLTLQSLFGIKSLFIYNQKEPILKKTKNNIHKVVKSRERLQRLNTLISPIHEIANIVIVGLSLILGVSILDYPNLSILLTFLTITYRLGGKVQAIHQSLGAVSGMQGSIQRINEILHNQDKQFEAKGGRNFQSFGEEIQFKDVSLQYPSCHYKALQKVSFCIPKGKTVAIVGPSGAGKSSIIDLLLGLYAPTEGSIYIDHQNLNNLNLISWRSLLGVVAQDIFILNDTIEENIRFGNEKASYEQIIKAAKASGCLDFILPLSQGFQTLVGEKGYRLSGGEKQRISLARALLRDPQILILDEATSNLDSYSEHIIQNSIAELTGRKTILIIAHRLSTIRHADMILFLEKGNIIEQGNHQTLLGKEGKYAFYWRLQSSKQPVCKSASNL